jgi:hypothetical protein
VFRVECHASLNLIIRSLLRASKDWRDQMTQKTLLSLVAL